MSNVFPNYRSIKKLREMAKKPYDLTIPNALSEERIENFSLRDEFSTYIYAMERINEEVLSTLFELAEESRLLVKMEAMQRGSVVNFMKGDCSTENRKVLHTALRTWVDTNSSEDLSYEEKQSLRECNKLKNFLNEINKNNRFKSIVQIGIGGSELGPKAIYYALESFSISGRKAYFISNVDPDAAASVLRGLDLSTTLVVVVSKSGTTQETFVNEKLVAEEFKKSGCNPKDHFIAVTQEGSPMDNLTNYLEVFHIWDYVGGRYSATSMVGGVLLSFTLGFENFERLLRGARYMDCLALNSDYRTNLPLLMAMIGIWNRNFLQLPTLAILPYGEPLFRFPAHLQQCDMESNGKHVTQEGKDVDFSTGPVVWGEPGTNGQHSFYQFLHQGTEVVPLEFIGFRNNQSDMEIMIDGTSSRQKLLANLFAQSIAFATGQKDKDLNRSFEGNRPNSLLLFDKLDPFSMGYLLALYEHKIVFQGFCWGINSFDQEGVQLGKILATKVLDIMSGRSSGESFPQANALIKKLKLV